MLKKHHLRGAMLGALGVVVGIGLAQFFGAQATGEDARAQGAARAVATASYDGLEIANRQTKLGEAADEPPNFLETSALGWMERQADFVVVADKSDNNVAGTFALKYRDVPTTARRVALNVVGWNANSRIDANTQALYIEGARLAKGAGNSVSLEVEAVNVAPPQTAGPVNPYASQKGLALGLWLASGGDPVIHPNTHPADTAMTIFNNGNTWAQGMIVKHDALSPVTSALTGARAKRAIELAEDHHLSWYAKSEGAPAREVAALVARDTGSLEMTAERQVQIAAQRSVRLISGDSQIRMHANGSLELQADQLRITTNEIGVSVYDVASADKLFTLSKTDGTLYIHKIPTSASEVADYGLYATANGTLKIKLP